MRHKTKRRIKPLKRKKCLRGKGKGKSTKARKEVIKIYAFYTRGTDEIESIPPYSYTTYRV